MLQHEYVLPAGVILVDDEGADSDVYQVGKRALKIYTYYTQEQIENYRDLVRRAADWVAGHPVHWKVDGYEFSLHQIVLIESISLLNSSSPLLSFHTYPAAESEFIVGPNGSHFEHLETFSEQWLEGLEQDEKNRLQQLKADMWKDGSNIFSQLKSELAGATGSLNSALGVAGIDIIPYNIKFRMPSQNSVLCEVTDIASQIRNIANR